MPGHPVSWLWELPYDFLRITKPGLTSLVLFTTFVGFYAGVQGPLPLALLFHTLAGTALVAGGAAAFNMYVERQLDMLMKRTALRPIASGRLQAGHALVFAMVISAGGFVYLYLLVNHLASVLSAIIFAGYLFLYTPLKTRTWWSTFIGAVPGALPAVLGWTAATRSVSFESWSLFIIVFLWQMPHFYAIGWRHREDYEHAGFSLLPAVVGGERRIRWLAPCFILALIPAASLPYITGIAGGIYLIGSSLLGILFFFFGLHFSRSMSNRSAHRLFIVSALYLPALLVLLIVDKTVR
ncbi:MAG: heme o synthase [Acidobacteriota bacterium]